MPSRLGSELPAGRVRAITPPGHWQCRGTFGRCHTPPAGPSILACDGDLEPFITIDGGIVRSAVNRRLCEGGRVPSRTQSLAYFAKPTTANPILLVYQSDKVKDCSWVDKQVSVVQSGITTDCRQSRPRHQEHVPRLPPAEEHSRIPGHTSAPGSGPR